MTSQDAHPVDQQQFEALMQEIDKDLRQRQVPSDQRALRAAFEILKSAGTGARIDAALLSGTYHGRPGCFQGQDLLAHTLSWFHAKYGTAQKHSMRLGVVATHIDGDPWLMTIPLFFGTIRIFADPTIPPRQGGARTAQARGPIAVNVLDHVQNIPPQVRSRLTLVDCLRLLRHFRRGVHCYRRFNLSAATPLARTAFDDLELSARQIEQRSYGPPAGRLCRQ